MVLPPRHSPCVRCCWCTCVYVFSAEVRVHLNSVIINQHGGEKKSLHFSDLLCRASEWEREVNVYLWTSEEKNKVFIKPDSVRKPWICNQQWRLSLCVHQTRGACGIFRTLYVIIIIIILHVCSPLQQWHFTVFCVSSTDWHSVKKKWVKPITAKSYNMN